LIYMGGFMRRWLANLDQENEIGGGPGPLRARGDDSQRFRHNSAVTVPSGEGKGLDAVDSWPNIHTDVTEPLVKNRRAFLGADRLPGLELARSLVEEAQR
jgi:hypothetical protein